MLKQEIKQLTGILLELLFFDLVASETTSGPGTDADADGDGSLESSDDLVVLVETTLSEEKDYYSN